MLPTAGQLCCQLPVPPIALDLNDKLRAFYLFIFLLKNKTKQNWVCLDFSWKPAFLSPIQAHLKCHCFLEPCVGHFFTSFSPLWKFCTVYMPLSPTFPSPPCWGGWLPILCWKGHLKGIGGKESFQTTCWPSLETLLSRCVWESASPQAILLSCFTRGRGALALGPSSTFWMHIGKEANLASKSVQWGPKSESQSSEGE